MRNSPRVNNYSSAIPPLTIECRDLTAQLSLDRKTNEDQSLEKSIPPLTTESRDLTAQLDLNINIAPDKRVQTSKTPKKVTGYKYATE